MRIVVKKLNDDVAPKRLERFALSQEIIGKHGSFSRIHPGHSACHRLPASPRTHPNQLQQMFAPRAPNQCTQ
jgi:hypothetical protein